MLQGHPADAAGAAQELRGIGLGGYEVPEWKTKALGKAPTFGMRDARPIKEQRESLPIFKLRDQLVQAVAENQARCYTRLPLQNSFWGFPHARGRIRRSVIMLRADVAHQGPQ